MTTQPKSVELPNLSNPETRLAMEVNEQYAEAFMYKESLGLHRDWLTFEDYYLGNQNPPEDEDDPASVTPIIAPIVDAFVADLVNTPLEVTVKGWAEADRAHAPRAQMALEYILEKNRIDQKRDRFERYRVKFGTGIWKVFFQGDVSVSGMPIIEPVSPFRVFPDPKIKSPDQIHEADFIIHAVTHPISFVKRVYGSKADRIQESVNPRFSPDLGRDYAYAYGKHTRNRVTLLERWSIEPDGHLRKVVAVLDQPIILYDSDDDPEARRLGYYSIERYPWVFVPCYAVEGRLWGQGVIERLKPIQDIINDLDDQIRLNARLTGNVQVVVDVNSGIDPYRWTNTPGLKIPTRILPGFQVVQPPPLPAYINERRMTALTYEAEFVSGRTDVTEGRRPGSLRAASAILALQEAASRRVRHMLLMSRIGLEHVLSIALDYITEYWTEEVEVGEELVYGERRPIRLRGTDLKRIPIFDERGVPMIDPQTGQPMTRRASFDVTVNMGDGLPLSRVFVYQAVIELANAGLLTREEGRALLKQVLSFPIIDPWNPVGEYNTAQRNQGTDVFANSQQSLPLEQIAEAILSGTPPTFPGV